MRQIAVPGLLILLLLCSSAMAQEDIVGKWKGESSFGDKLSYEFKADNTVVWIVDKPTFPGPITARYTVDYTTKPVQLDMFEFSFKGLKGIKFMGIVEFLSPTKMKMDGIRAEMKSDKERPTEFTNDTIEFEKVE